MVRTFPCDSAHRYCRSYSVTPRLSGPRGVPNRGISTRMGVADGAEEVDDDRRRGGGARARPAGRCRCRTGGSQLDQRRRRLSEHAIATVGVEAQGRQRRRARDEVGVHDRGRRVGDAGGRRRTPSTCPTGPASCTRSTRRPDSRVEDQHRRRRAVCRSTRRGRRRRSPSDKVIVGTQGCILVPGGGPGGKVLAFDKAPGSSCGAPQADAHRRRSSRSRRPCSTARCTWAWHRWRRRSPRSCPAIVLHVPRQHAGARLETGAIVWKTYMAPTGYTRQRGVGQLAGDRHEAQPGVHRDGEQLLRARSPCSTASSLQPATRWRRRRASPADDYFDSILALDMTNRRGEVGDRAIPFDAWTVDCIPSFGDGDLCPDPAGPDYDFGQAPALFTVKAGRAASRRARRRRPEERSVLGARSGHGCGACG